MIVELVFTRVHSSEGFGTPEPDLPDGFFGKYQEPGPCCKEMKSYTFSPEKSLKLPRNLCSKFDYFVESIKDSARCKL